MDNNPCMWKPLPHKPKKIISQKEFADNVVSDVKTLIEHSFGLSDLCDSLTTVLDLSQNRPPEGGSDESISGSYWMRLKNLRDSLRQVTECLDLINRPVMKVCGICNSDSCYHCPECKEFVWEHKIGCTLD